MLWLLGNCFNIILIIRIYFWITRCYASFWLDFSEWERTNNQKGHNVRVKISLFSNRIRLYIYIYIYIYITLGTFKRTESFKEYCHFSLGILNTTKFCPKMHWSIRPPTLRPSKVWQKSTFTSNLGKIQIFLWVLSFLFT